ncbi:hypothetical protein GCU54_04435 [Geodermatophilus normandii]|uniref:Uncharacterized protein n=1 Tax=Geodermatophilus normandii TaxID=1137989 RepID=A0A6P0GBK5_9ACTN|nr:hypothetical protein [Geodermatophilus normandii]
MGILNRLLGTAETTARRGAATGRGAAGRATTGRGTSGRGMSTGRSAGMGRTRMSAGTPTRRMGRGAPTTAASGGLGRLLGSLTGRR